MRKDDVSVCLPGMKISVSILLSGTPHLGRVELMKIPRHIFRWLRSRATDYKEKAAISRLANSSSHLARQLSSGLEASRKNSHKAEDQAWFQKIESFRSELSKSQESLETWDRPWLGRSSELREHLGVVTEGDDAPVSMTVARACQASKSAKACRLLYYLVRATQPNVVVELGTNIGISGLYLAAALERNQKGKLVTLEGAAPKAEVARKNFQRMGLDRQEIVVGDFFETLDGVIEKHRPIDLGFIDGFHDGQATEQFHKMLACGAEDEALLIYDDIRWSEGMKQAWQNIQKMPDVKVATDLSGIGFSVVGPR